MSSNSTSRNHNDLPFNYVPSFAAGIVFVVLFSVVTTVHLGQALRARMWWLLPTVVIGGVGEIIGWAGRLWGSKNPTSQNAFLMQITTTIISPTFILAANFVIVGLIIRKLGTKYSRLSPRLYTIVFCTCDVIALVIQSIGGAMASTANTASGSATGGHIALGGIAFQFAAIVIYMLLSIEFLIRFALKKPFSRREDTLNGTRLSVLDSKTKQMIVGAGLSSLAMFIRWALASPFLPSETNGFGARGVYRTVELAGGWRGKVISVQRYFIALDGAMIVLSMVALNIFHPGRLMDDKPAVEEKKNNSMTEI
ncbi:RTA1-domain-containing protein [Thelephora ganbajun]|uniref:RTA1-domain-containing protein n=1 Tax=Thelephora ganbajun TaxID=370292 RepID=A0ACB6ZCD3_THEGA|nr:RTA1-domain-containing protein [Thelephora ganbajun]